MKLSKKELEYIYYDLIDFKSDWLLGHGCSRSEMLMNLMDKFRKELDKTMNLKNYTLADLRKKYLKCVKVEERTSKFLNLQYALDREISKRQRAKIYKTCCWALKNYGSNQFFMAKLHTDATMKELWASDDHYEISSHYTKNKIPVLVWFD